MQAFYLIKPRLIGWFIEENSIENRYLSSQEEDRDVFQASVWRSYEGLLEIIVLLGKARVDVKNNATIKTKHDSFKQS